MFLGLNFKFLAKYYPMYFTGLWMTVKLSFFTLLISSVVGIAMGLVRSGHRKGLNTLIDAWIGFIRGVPVLLQIFIVYYGIAKTLPQFWAGVAALSINSSVYIAEHTRAGIQAINKGQMEAARCIGMTALQGNWYIIIPQAVKNILPSLANEFVLLIKNTSIVSTIAIRELTYYSSMVRTNTFLAFEPLIITAVIYWSVTTVLQQIIKVVEGRLHRND